LQGLITKWPFSISVGRNKRKTRRKTFKGGGKNQAIVCWKEEGEATLMLQKEIA
jgi:hypothetical protein